MGGLRLFDFLFTSTYLFRDIQAAALCATGFEAAR